MPDQVTEVLPDPVLTGLAVSLGTGGAYASDRIAPVAHVLKDEFKYAKFGREEIKDDTRSEVAAGIPAAEVKFALTYATGSISYRKLKSRVPDAIRANDPFNRVDNRRTAMLMGKLRLGIEKRVEVLVSAASNTKAAPGTKWNAASPDIRGDLLAGKTIFRKNAGFPPNTIVIPPIVYDVVANDSDIVELVKRRKDVLASEILEEILQMAVVVPGAIQDTSAPGAAENIADIWNSDEVYYMFVDPAAGDDLDALTALRQVRSVATGANGLYVKKYRDSDESAEADWVSVHVNQTEITVADELILRQLDVLT